jgi:hypothetical protein
VIVIFVSAEAPGARARVCASTLASQASVASVMRPFINSGFLVLVRVLEDGSRYRFCVTGSKDSCFSSVCCALMLGSRSCTLSVR